MSRECGWVVCDVCWLDLMQCDLLEIEVHSDALLLHLFNVGWFIM
jgi:hypothetical protein